MRTSWISRKGAILEKVGGGGEGERGGGRGVVLLTHFNLDLHFISKTST